MAKRILVVDDEAPIREVLRALLEEEGYEVEVAEDGKDGEGKAIVVKPDLVILDLSMPRRGGLEVLKFIRGYGPTKDIPVIILTGQGSLPKRIATTLAGAHAYIKKPFNNQDIIERVGQLVTGSEA